jgi:hypothetical protein
VKTVFAFMICLIAIFTGCNRHDGTITTKEEEQIAEDSISKEKNERKSTIYEALASRSGVLTITDQNEVGNLLRRAPTGDLRDKRFWPTIYTCIVSTLQDSTKVLACLIELPHLIRPGSESGYLDFDELEPWLNAIDQMIKWVAKMKNEKREYTVIKYTSRGGISIGFYQVGLDQIAYLELSRFSSEGMMLIDITQLTQMQKLFLKARNKLIALGAR